FASHTPGPSFASGVSRKSPAYSLPGSPPITTSLRPACSRGLSGVRITTTWVNCWPNDSKSMYSTRLVYVVVAGYSSAAAIDASSAFGSVSRSAGNAARSTANRISFMWNAGGSSGMGRYFTQSRRRFQMTQSIELTVNGKRERVEVQPDTPLLYVLRND